MMATNIERAETANPDVPAEDRSVLTARDIADLSWFWNEFDTECGVQSNFGAMRDALALYNVRADARTFDEDTGELVDAPRGEVVHLALAPAPKKKRARKPKGPDGRHYECGEALTDEMHVSSAHTVPWKSLGEFEGSIVMTLADSGDHSRAVRKASRIRRRLKRMPLEDVFVLFAVYGPQWNRGHDGEDERGRKKNTADPVGETIRTKYGALAKVVVMIAGSRANVYQRLSDSAFVVEHKRKAAAMLNAAARAYKAATWT